MLSLSPPIIVEVYEQATITYDLFNEIQAMKQYKNNYIFILSEMINKHQMKDNIKQYLLKNGYTYTKNIVVDGKTKRGYKKLKQMTKRMTHMK